MSGEGILRGCSDGHLPTSEYRFDQRPGALEATAPFAPTSGLIVCGSRDQRRQGGGWLVLVTVSGERGELCQVAIPPEAARRAARELVDMCDVLEGIKW